MLDFAAMKLINAEPSELPSNGLSEGQKLACLSARLAIDFNSTTYTGQRQEHAQVERHMRICLNVDDGFETMKTIFPSEPLLAEAAARFMTRTDFKAPEALKEIMGGFSIHKGDRGELLALLLLCLARDAALTGDRKTTTVYDFMDKLFPNLSESNSRKGTFHPSVVKEGTAAETFKKCFTNSHIYFNHFIKVHESGILNRKYLWRVFLRGGAIICANSQGGIDILIPFVHESQIIAEANISVMLIQVKNDPQFGATPDTALFDAMDPFKQHIFNKGDESTPPIIRIVFAMASRKADLVRMPKREKKAGFTSFDFWCAGLSEEVIGPITEDEQSIWEALLQASRGWQDIYKADTPRGELRRAACAGAGQHPAHWQNFTTDVPGKKRLNLKRRASDSDGRRDGRVYHDTECDVGPDNIEDSDIVMLGPEEEQ
jgi:hypothetical protein